MTALSALGAVVALLASQATAALVARDPPAPVSSATCNGKQYIYEEMAGWGYVKSSARDKFGDSLGGLGSAIHIDKASWRREEDGNYMGTLWSLPDRGWNTEGTLNFQPRVHKFNITFGPGPGTGAGPETVPNLDLTYVDTIRFSGPDGTPCTGLDANQTGHFTFPGFPDLPLASYEGDGFGGEGPGGKRIPVDSEGLYVNKDGTFWVSDEYGPYIYRFDQNGTMLAAIRPPDALIPFRNGTESFSSNNPVHYIDNGKGPGPIPEDPDHGRDNNSGFEGLHVSDDEKTLYVMLQSATVHEGGLHGKSRRHARMLKYDVSSKVKPTYAGEYVVPLPLYADPTDDGAQKVAKQSELHSLANGQFLVLARDSGSGRGNGEGKTESVYRHIDIVDISAATDLKAADAYDCSTCTISSDPATGAVKKNIKPALYCPWLDFNDNDQLSRFSLHNGGKDDDRLLNEKWESIAVVPVDPTGKGPRGQDEYFIFSLSDNDFITQHGYLNNGKFKYADSSKNNLDNQALVFKVKIPK